MGVALKRVEGKMVRDLDKSPYTIQDIQILERLISKERCQDLKKLMVKKLELVKFKIGLQ